jgi:hypothetical protein
MDDDLVESVDGLLSAALAAARTPDVAARLTQISDRLHGPLLVAIAGKVKAGKSTLLNALLGEALAAVDAGECTRIVTWYRRAAQPQVFLQLLDGQRASTPFRRSGGELEIELGGHSAEQIERLDVEWPTPRLADLTLIDTPGIASISADVSARTHRFLTPEDEHAPEVDAIVYLLRHTHSSDAHFLEAFHDDRLARGSPMNVVGVLSRADEIGSCRMDCLDVADRVARRYQGDARLRRLCPVVVPVAGLLANAGATLREVEFGALARVAALPPATRTALLLTADRFRTREVDLDVTELERTHLLERLGLFGVRLSVELISTRQAPDATTLAHLLSERSGLDRLRDVLAKQFLHRSQLLKARSALSGLQELLRADGCTGAASLQAHIEQVVTGTHAFEELRLLTALRGDDLGLSAERAVELDRVLGGSGHDARSRLGLPPDADQDAVRDTALQALAHWQRVAAHPLSNRSLQLAARGACRTLEGIVADQISPSRST